MPVGPYSLWPGERVEVAVERLHVDRHVRRGLRAVDQHRHARGVRHARRSRATGLMVPSAFETCATATSCVRGVSSARTRRASSSPRSSIGDDRSARAASRSHSSCQGTMFEWCSIAGDQHLVAGRDVAAGRSVCATRLMPSVAFAREDDLARRRGVEEARAPSRARPRRPSVARSLSRCARRGGRWRCRRS